MGENLGPVIVQVKSEPVDDYNTSYHDMINENGFYVNEQNDKSSCHTRNELTSPVRDEICFSGVRIKEEPVDDIAHNDESAGGYLGGVKLELVEDESVVDYQNGLYDTSNDLYTTASDLYTTHSDLYTTSSDLRSTYTSALYAISDPCVTPVRSPVLRYMLGKKTSSMSVNLNNLPDSSVAWIRKSFQENEISAWERQIMNSVEPEESEQTQEEFLKNQSNESSSTKSYHNPSSQLMKDSPLVRSLLTAPLSSYLLTPYKNKKRKATLSSPSIDKPSKRLCNKVSNVGNGNYKNGLKLGDHISNQIESLLTKSSEHKSEIVETKFKNDDVTREEPMRLRNSTRRSTLKSLLKAPDVNVNSLIHLKDSFNRKDDLPPLSKSPTSATNGESSVIKALLKAPLPPQPPSFRSKCSLKSPSPEPGRSRIRALLEAPLKPLKRKPVVEQPVLLNLLTEDLSSKSRVKSLVLSDGRLRSLLTKPLSELKSSDSIVDTSLTWLASDSYQTRQPHSPFDHEEYKYDPHSPSNSMIVYSSKRRRIIHGSDVSSVGLQPLERIHEFPEDYDNTQDSEGMFMCFECGDDFSSESELSSHKSAHHNRHDGTGLVPQIKSEPDPLFDTSSVRPSQRHT